MKSKPLQSMTDFRLKRILEICTTGFRKWLSLSLRESEPSEASRSSHVNVREKNDNVILTLWKIVKILRSRMHDNGVCVWCMQKLVTKCYLFTQVLSFSFSLSYIDTGCQCFPVPSSRYHLVQTGSIRLLCCNNFSFRQGRGFLISIRRPSNRISPNPFEWVKFRREDVL